MTERGCGIRKALLDVALAAAVAVGGTVLGVTLSPSTASASDGQWKCTGPNTCGYGTAECCDSNSDEGPGVYCSTMCPIIIQG